MALDSNSIFHKPVLPNETLEFLGGGLLQQGNASGTDELMVDGTLGEGGHSELFLRRFSGLRVVGIDADRVIMESAKQRLSEFGARVLFHEGWADDFFKFYPQENTAFPRPGIILLDLGVSLFHYEKGGRGFSFQSDELLDMRIDTSRGENAAALLNTLNEEELANLLFQNAGERHSRRIARAIIAERQKAPLKNARELARLVCAAVPPPARHRKTHAATKTFAALRIAVNGELERLPALLKTAFSVLKPGGRFGVISFHSLEDRIIKNYFKELAKDCICPPSAPKCVCRGKRLARQITPKGITASKDELSFNPPSRSARLRVVEKIFD
ncbi:MAG: 16S rRNA (cytosine(1402)-N(4))-methyltransferase RsmH [Spirochaetaceae bacterium]|jgi:16S rRNA (cytosine1402-N4)-methyltransferase|nr:16S rRNA (cytosine(1402)-N(4))-methyltransferase RsmH [Spirochaetaceae bacterium]